MAIIELPSKSDSELRKEYITRIRVAVDPIYESEEIFPLPALYSWMRLLEQLPKEPQAVRQFVENLAAAHQVQT